ncbi:hypothetical protein WJX73_002060 [Symbiochloris irregularis]|uniref:Small ribosomal subunit protein uS9c n=1 Tax=Symbiochloris irregularis TaxID=706552 RepID=A0AAW1PUG5_9CHLO
MLQLFGRRLGRLICPSRCMSGQAEGGSTPGTEPPLDTAESSPSQTASTNSPTAPATTGSEFQTTTLPAEVPAGASLPLQGFQQNQFEGKEWSRLIDRGRYTRDWGGSDGLGSEMSIEDRMEQLGQAADAERAARHAKEMAIQQEHAAKLVQKIDERGRAYGTGKRKASVARVWIWEGQGNLDINGRTLDAYFGTMPHRLDVLTPFSATGTLDQFDMRALVRGGGNTGQAQALRHGIAKALQAYSPPLHSRLKSFGLLTRDSRVVERKKPGKAKARKSFQWVKR